MICDECKNTECPFPRDYAELQYRRTGTCRHYVSESKSFVTYITNETQTHYTFDKDPGPYVQCLTCKNLAIEYLVGSERLDCTDKHVPVLPECLFYERSGLTLKQL